MRFKQYCFPCIIRGMKEKSKCFLISPKRFSLPIFFSRMYLFLPFLWSACVSFSSIDKPRDSKQYLKSWRRSELLNEASHPIHHVIQEHLSASKLETLQNIRAIRGLTSWLTCETSKQLLVWRGLSVSPDPLTIVHWLINMQFSSLFILFFSLPWTQLRDVRHDQCHSSDK